MTNNNAPAVNNPTFLFLTILMFAFLLAMAAAKDFSLLGFLDQSTLDLRILVMLLLAEPHFAMTIPLLWGYRELFRKEKIYFVHIPLLLVCCSSVLFFTSISLYSYLFLLANVYHVNRQSRGMLIIQGKADLKTANFYEFTLHLTCLLVFLSRTLLGPSPFFGFIALFLITGVLLISLWFSSIPKENLHKKFFIALQGYLIFLPAILFDDILLAFAVGISIHYLQYLAISFPVCKKSFGFSIAPLILFLIAYSMLSTGALSGFFTSENFSLIVFIPTTLQLLHFYYDGFIWRKSNTRVRAILKKASL